ncbi:helix-turn-helix domain-containing protein [Pseudomonas poae]|uniref:Helix-turn-helix domain-containing protein n=1 Tax=Pseudomonas edaphica TaxID=2006980 RepID=A0A7Y7VA40_9PSED|nr:helix-turn-helix domain-containing protein [Pseudomonas edaphica]NVZ60377.1 helix-turn-helix domain-containing protein [Pseudomonas edaphica]
MDYLEALGQVLREVRVAVGLNREGCAQVLNRDNLAKVEQGRQAISLLKLNSLCECLGISQSLVLTAVEARLADIDLKAYRCRQEDDFNRMVNDGVLSRSINHDAIRGARGKRADENRSAIQALQAEGLAKMEVVRRLGLSRATIDRHWLKS